MTMDGSRDNSRIAALQRDEILGSKLPDHRSPNSYRWQMIRRQKLGDISSIPRQSVISMVGAVGCFKRWLWTGDHSLGKDMRSMTDIPPEQLDVYLAEFFTKVKRPNGAEYNFNSFVTFRTYLSRYLRQCNYPESISSSPRFAKSQLAFMKKKDYLQKLQTETTM